MAPKTYYTREIDYTRERAFNDLLEAATRPAREWTQLLLEPVREMQRAFNDLMFPLSSFDGRDPAAPRRQEHIPPAGETEKLTEWEKALVEKWVNTNHEYPTVEAFARAHNTSKTHVHRVLGKAERVHNKKYRMGKGRRRR